MIGELRGSNEKEIVLITAHLDTVFPSGTTIEVQREASAWSRQEFLTTVRGLRRLLAIARAMHAAQIKPQRTILFVANVGEEGEGNLRGMRALVDAYHTKAARGDRIWMAPARIT